MARNSFFSVMSQVILIAVGFFSQRVMALRLGKDLIGMNGVIANVIAILSVSELGISTAVVYHLYRAIAQRDENRIAALMNLYRRAYKVFALAITALGLLVLPFVHLFLKDSTFPVSYVRLVYALWLSRTVLSYLLSYRRSILIADQREYLVSLVTLLMNVLNYGFIIVILLSGGSYVFALTVNIITEVVLNTALNAYISRAYPFLVALRREPLPGDVVRRVVQDVKNIFVTRLCSKLLYSTDNLIISGLISVGTVGLYTNYSLITQSVSNVLLALSNAVQPSIGSLFTDDDCDKDEEALRQMTFAFFLLAASCAACLLGLMTPFVSDIWLGKEFTLDRIVVVWCSINCFAQTLGMPLSVVMGVTGLFDRERNLSVLSAAVNVIFSVWLVRYFGIAGVLAGTFGAYCVQIVFRVRFFYCDYLGRSCVRYVSEIAGYTALAAAELAVTGIAADFCYGSGGIARFVLTALVSVLLPLAANLLVFCRSGRLRVLARLVRKLVPDRAGK